MKLISIPGAFFDHLATTDDTWRERIESIDRIGSGRQYQVDIEHPSFALLVDLADAALVKESDPNASEADILLQGVRRQEAISMLRAIRRQGVHLDLQNELPVQRTQRPLKRVTRNTLSYAFGGDAGKALIITIEAGEDVISIRPSGTRRAELVSIQDVYAWALRSRANSEFLAKARAKKAALKLKREAAKLKRTAGR
jgi:hypothetical protein